MNKESKYFINIGKSLKSLEDALDHEIWRDLSKHNEYWDSEHEKEDDKLGDIRLHLSLMKEILYDLIANIESYDDEES
jgi:hypothetical protein